MWESPANPSRRKANKKTKETKRKNPAKPVDLWTRLWKYLPRNPQTYEGTYEVHNLDSLKFDVSHDSWDGYWYVDSHHAWPSSICTGLWVKVCNMVVSSKMLIMLLSNWMCKPQQWESCWSCVGSSCAPPPLNDLDKDHTLGFAPRSNAVPHDLNIADSGTQGNDTRPHTKGTSERLSFRM